MLSEIDQFVNWVRRRTFEKVAPPVDASRASGGYSAGWLKSLD